MMKIANVLTREATSGWTMMEIAKVFSARILSLPPRNSMEHIDPSGVVLTGSAPAGTLGRIGLHDIYESDDAYYFRVSLPGVATEEDFSCDIIQNGYVLIRGVNRMGGKTVFSHSMKFEMLTQNLGPKGDISVRFKFPGLVDPQVLDAQFVDGIYEGTVKKRIAAN